MDREKVITALEFCTDTKPVETCFGKCPYAVADDDYRCRDMKLDALALLKEQEAWKFLVDENGKITPLPVVVRCKDCKHSFDKDGTYYCSSLLSDRIALVVPDWFCADGERK